MLPMSPLSVASAAQHAASAWRYTVSRRTFHDSVVSLLGGLLLHLLRVAAGASRAVHLQAVVKSLLGRLHLSDVSTPHLHRLPLQRPRVGEGELPRQAL